MQSASRSVAKNILMKGTAVLPSLPSLLTCLSIQHLGKEALEMTFLSRLMGGAEVESRKQTQNK